MIVLIIILIIICSYLYYKWFLSHGLSPKQLRGLSSKQSHGLSPKQSHGLSPKQLRGLSTKQSHGLSIKQSHGLSTKQSHGLSSKNAKKEYIEMEIYVNENLLGTICIELFSSIVPKTCKNFLELSKKHYINCPFHRIIKDFMIQGGDFTKCDGTGGYSIYGPTFDDENFKIPHDSPYLLSMANAGVNTNGSQFFITTKSTQHLDGKHVVFGKVVEGTDIIDLLNNVDVDVNDKPIDVIYIKNTKIIKM
jgi:peptidylprolyl isomerase